MIQYEAAVIGNPISHSLSPGIFSFLANRLGKLDFNYQAKNIESKDMRHFIQEVKSNRNFIGFNVTIPYKEPIIELLNHLTTEAQTIGAVNVVHKEGEMLYGHNTDVHGIFMTLEKNQCYMEGRNAFVLGAGGAARGIAYVLGSQKAKQVNFFNNDFTRAKLLAYKFKKIFPETRFRACTLQAKLEPIDLWVNATPLGMSANPLKQQEQVASDYFTYIYKTIGFSFSENAHAFDLIYRPEETPFLILARKIGLSPIGGLNMLVEQALQTWTIWFGPTPKLENIKPELINYLRHRPLFLSGFMGVGKSTVGAILAEKLGWEFIDIDLLIERDTKMSISEFFEKKGEASFRKIECEITNQFCFSTRTVIALGGGALSTLAIRNKVEKSGQLIFLSAQIDTLLERLKTAQKNRPLLESILAEKNLNEQRLQIKALLKKREESYSGAALKFETDHFSPEEIAQQIIGRL